MINKIDKNLIFEEITGLQPLSQMILPIIFMMPIFKYDGTIHWDLYKSPISEIYIVERWKEDNCFPGIKYEHKKYEFNTRKEAEDFLLIEKLCQ